MEALRKVSSCGQRAGSEKPANRVTGAEREAGESEAVEILDAHDDRTPDVA